MINDILKRIGLTDYETKVYLALLELGKSTSGEILNKAELRTGKIYEILGSLKSKGLVSELTESGVKKFFPTDPKQIQNYLKDKKKEINNQEKDFEKILPELLKKVNSKKGEVHIEIFYGIRGLKSAYFKEFDYYKKHRIIRIMGVKSSQSYSKEHYNFFTNIIYPKRISSKISIKKIYSNEARKDDLSNEDTSNIRFVQYTSPITFVVIDKLTIIGIKSKDTIISMAIESEEVANSFIEQFELLWKIAKK